MSGSLPPQSGTLHGHPSLKERGTCVLPGTPEPSSEILHGHYHFRQPAVDQLFRPTCLSRTFQPQCVIQHRHAASVSSASAHQARLVCCSPRLAAE